MNKVYILNEEESKLIENHRKSIIEHQERILNMKSCKHDWRYDGHSHNDDCYVCTICGETDYR